MPQNCRSVAAPPLRSPAKEDFLGAAIFTLAAASLQGQSLLEREEIGRRGTGGKAFVDI